MEDTEDTQRRPSSDDTHSTTSVTSPHSSSPRADATGDSRPSAALNNSPGPLLKKVGRGMSMRRRIGLKIEADESEATGGEGAKGGDSGSSKREGDGGQCGGEEWWKVEYKAPPPGHLGAHALPVPFGSAASTIGETQRGRQDEHKSPTAHHHSSIERKLERMEVTATDSTQHVTRHIHETPERANRRVRGGNDLHDASFSHSSPNQKRKIIDLQDTSMSVAKELKRFHEPNDEQLQHSGSRDTSIGKDKDAVTPSNLMRPMTKIDIQAGSNSSVQPNNSGRVTHVHNTKASESA